MGARDYSIRKIFFYVSFFLVIAGILIGNFIGIGLGLLQNHFHLIKIPEDTYYFSYAPVALDWQKIRLLNAGTFVIYMFILLIPASIVARVKPVKAIRFE